MSQNVILKDNGKIVILDQEFSLSEVVFQAVRDDKDSIIDVLVINTLSSNVSQILDVLNIQCPLHIYKLSHLKRIRRLLDSNCLQENVSGDKRKRITSKIGSNSVIVQIIVCPSAFVFKLSDDVQSILKDRSLCIENDNISVCAFEALSKEVFVCSNVS
jgi:hypothetical protein